LEHRHNHNFVARAPSQIVLNNTKKIKMLEIRNNNKIVIINYLILSILVIVIISSCAIKKNLTEKEKGNIKKLDSIIYEEKLMREIDYRENQEMQ